MISTEIEAVKSDLRAMARQLRGSLSEDTRKEASEAIARNFLSAGLFERHDNIAAYWAIRDEVDCQPLLVKLADMGQPVCLPVVRGEGLPLEMRLWESGEPLYPAGFGALAPNELAPTVEPDLILMPLLGFDNQGTRLGYGGGYYDVTIASARKRPKCIGLAFACQRLDHIPSEAHDIPLDAVVTEEGVSYFGVSP